MNEKVIYKEIENYHRYFKYSIVFSKNKNTYYGLENKIFRAYKFNDFTKGLNELIEKLLNANKDCTKVLIFRLKYSDELGDLNYFDNEKIYWLSINIFEYETILSDENQISIPDCYKITENEILKYKNTKR